MDAMNGRRAGGPAAARPLAIETATTDAAEVVLVFRMGAQPEAEALLRSIRNALARGDLHIKLTGDTYRSADEEGGGV